jgi:DNA replication and repair protein RecF
MVLDGSPVERLTDTDARPLLSVFFPDRMELIKGSPSLRRAHLNQLVDTLWPGRRAVRQRYSHALLQRNALLASIRAGRSSPSALPSWDRELAHHAVQVIRHRREAIGLLEEPFCSRTSDLGLDGTGSIKYVPKSRAEDPEQFLAELSDYLSRDLNRGFSTYGPHRDDLAFSTNARDLRSYGSQGEQRLTLLALLLAERDVLLEVCGSTPLMLLDDVMSELDRSRRELLIDALSNDGQSIITTTDPDHVPTRDPDSVRYLAVTAGAISESDYEYRSGVLT